MNEYEFCKEQINCDECRFSDFGKSSNCCFDRVSYEQGRADREEELQGLKDLGNLYSEIRADERAKVIDELLDLDCKRDVTQDECDAYVSTSGCGQCKLNRILKKAERLKEQEGE